MNGDFCKGGEIDAFTQIHTTTISYSRAGGRSRCIAPPPPPSRHRARARAHQRAKHQRHTPWLFGSGVRIWLRYGTVQSAHKKYCAHFLIEYGLIAPHWVVLSKSVLSMPSERGRSQPCREVRTTTKIHFGNALLLTNSKCVNSPIRTFREYNLILYK